MPSFEDKVEQRSSLYSSDYDSKESLSKLIIQLRGGNFWDGLSSFLLLINIRNLLRMTMKPPHHEWMSGSHTRPPYQGKYRENGPRSLKIQSTQKSELTKEEIRNLPHPDDRIINVEGHPELIIRRGRLKPTALYSNEEGEAEELYEPKIILRILWTE